MKHTFLRLTPSKMSGAALAALVSASLFMSAAHAQDNQDFDPSGTLGSAAGNGAAGGSGSFNTSLFFDENTGMDVLYSSGNNANFYGAAGTVTVDAPVTISTPTTATQLNVNTSSGSTETIGASGTTNAIIFNQTYNNQTFLDVGSANSSNVILNAPIDLVVNAATNPALYSGNFNNDSTHNVTINDFNVSTSGTAPYLGGLSFGSTNGGTYTFQGTFTNSTGNGETFAVGDSTGSVSTFTPTFVNAGNFGVTVNAGILYLQEGGSNLGTANFNGNGGEILTDAPDLNITNSLQTGSTLTFGTGTTDDATFSGNTVSLYGPSSVLNIQAHAGSEVHVALGSGIYIESDEPVNITGPGVVSLETSVYSNFAPTREPINLNNGTLLLNNGSSTVNGSALTIASVAPASVTAAQTVATLGGTGTAAIPVVAAGQYSVIAPGDPKVNGGVGTLRLNGGLSAEEGLTMKFTLDGAVTNAYSTIDFGGSDFVVGSSGTITFDFTNVGGALSTDKDYTILTGLTGEASDQYSTANFVFKAPAGYVVDVANPNSYTIGDGTFSVQFEAAPEPSVYGMMGLGLLALIGIRRIRQLT